MQTHHKVISKSEAPEEEGREEEETDGMLAFDLFHKNHKCYRPCALSQLNVTELKLMLVFHIDCNFIKITSLIHETCMYLEFSRSIRFKCLSIIKPFHCAGTF